MASLNLVILLKSIIWAFIITGPLTFSGDMRGVICSRYGEQVRLNTYKYILIKL